VEAKRQDWFATLAARLTEEAGDLAPHYLRVWLQVRQVRHTTHTNTEIYGPGTRAETRLASSPPASPHTPSPGLTQWISTGGEP
jgi:hypothetical protein